ncbi:MAG TPA: CNNM domain-containing protein [Phycisphaerae bacterium]|nr:CNNM domain-containing protein [Phycisphaerae bacterium]
MIADVGWYEGAFWIAACGVMVVASALYSGAETGLYCLNRLRLNLHVGQEDRRAIILQRLLGDQSGVLFMTLLGTNIANYLAPVCLTILFLHAGIRESRIELYTAVILTPIILIFGEILPKVVFERHADRTMLRYAPILAASYQVARWTGLIAFQNALSRFIFRKFHRQAPSGSAFHSRMEMYHLLHEAGAQGTLSRTQLFMLERVHVLHRIRVGSVMVPLHRVVMVPANATAGEAIATVKGCDFSRLPVFLDDRRRMIGVVHALDVLTSPPATAITRRLFPPIEVRHDTSVVDALSLMQKGHKRMAFVVDQKGRCLGIVTVKDLVEEIVGELAAW